MVYKLARTLNSSYSVRGQRSKTPLLEEFIAKMRFLSLIIGAVAYHSASTNSDNSRIVFPDDPLYLHVLHNNQRPAVNYNVSETTKDNAELAVRKGIDRFAYMLFQVVAQQNQGNFIFSTLSLSTVLGMTAQGAGGQNKRDLERVLGLPNDSSTTLIGFQRIADKSNYRDNVRSFFSANKIYVRNGSPLKRDFLDVTGTAFHSEAQSFDSNYPSRAAEIANGWVSHQTDDKILDAVSADTFSDSSIVLVNSLFFSSPWRRPFLELHTKKRPFYRGGVDLVSIDMMWGIVPSAKYGSLPTQNATFIALNFEEDSILGSPAAMMYIILPNERIGGMAALERTIGQIEPSQLQGELYSVNLTLPKFNIESSLDFVGPLQGLGVNELFTDHANFSGMTDESGSTRVEIKQKAILEVSEKGAVSAAATIESIVFLIGENATPKRTEFKADHPFLCVITWEGSPIVVARYNGPENP